MGDKSFPQEGEIWLVKFEKLKEFSKPYRPCLVVSNNAQNKFDTKIVVVAMTSEKIDDIQPFEVYVKNTVETGLDETSKILCNYPHTIYKKLRLAGEQRLGIASPEIMAKVKEALKIVLNLKQKSH